MAYKVKYSGVEIDALLDKINNIFDLIYPIGSVYISTTSTNPGTLFGGVWQRIGEGKTLIDCGNTYTAGSTGGSATVAHTHSVSASGNVGGHTLTTAEIPSHTHGLTSLTGYDDLNFINGSGIFMLQNSDTTYGRGSAKNAEYKYGSTGSTGSGGSHNHSYSFSTTSGEASNTNNMPPYLATYIWKRTA